MTEQHTDHATSNASAWASATRQYAAWRSQPSWVHRLVGGVVLLVLLGLAAILLVSSLVVGLVVAAVGGVALGAAALVRRFRGGSGQGRRNVRVIVRHTP